MMLSNTAAGRNPLDSQIIMPAKEGAYNLSPAGIPLGGSPPIPIDYFQHSLWNDPNVMRGLSPRDRAAASGVVEAAWNAGGQSPSRLVWPRDLARISAGMGAGYLSGALVGKALGALVGMPQDTQDYLKTTGMWAGVVKSVVPSMFQ